MMKQNYLKSLFLMLMMLVGMGAWAEKTYTKVTDDATLSDGDIIILACDAKSTFAGPMGTNSFLTSVSTKADAIEITLQKKNSSWNLNTSEGLIGTSVAKKLILDDGTDTWSISFTDGNAEIKSTNSTCGSIQYNASSPRFLNYATSQTAIQIYKVSDDGSTIPQPTQYSYALETIGEGTTTFKDASNNIVKPGDKVDNRTVITADFTPSEGYEFTSWEYWGTSDGVEQWKTLTGKTFTITKDVKFRVTFSEIQGGEEPETPSNPEGTQTYKKVTSQNDIVDGGVYLIVCESENTAMGSQNTNRRNNASISIDNNTISIDEVNTEGKPYEVTLSKSGTLFEMTLSNGKYLGNGAKSSNYLKEVTNFAAGYGWTLSYKDGYVEMKTNHAETPRYLCVNTANTDSYATYTDIGTYKKVTLYKKEAAPTVPTFASLEELIAANESYDAVNVTINEGVMGAMQHPMTGDYIVYLNGMITLASPGTNLGWEMGGTVSGTLENVSWDSGNRLLASETNFWSSLTYTAPAGAPTETIALNAACTDGEFVYGTYSSTNAWYVPEDLIVSEIGVIDGQLVVESYKTGDLVPPYTGVMVSATDGGNYEVEIETDYDMIDECAVSVLGDDNCLRPTCSPDGGITAEDMEMIDYGSTFYRLTMHNKTQIGFWWGAENGAGFNLGNNKAYLAVPQGAGVKANMWFTGEEDAIKGVEEKTFDTMIYDMQGRKVSKTQKGLYIVNGKKVAIK